MGINNWLVVVVAALASFMLGWIWYGPLFSKPWASGMGYDTSNSDMKMPPLNLVLSYLMSFFMAMALSAIMAAGSVAGAGAALQMAFLLWLGIVATTYTLNQIYDSRPWRVWAVNVGYHLASMLLIALILAVWP